jgi:DTW domain-containing protein YfiP
MKPMRASEPGAAASEGGSSHREVCYRCRKAKVACICSKVERVENDTEIVILQHPRERDHPLGTARFAKLGLSRVRVVVAHGSEASGLETRLDLPEGCALLFPGAGVPTLDELPPARRPRSLLVLDGTWSTAGKLHRDNPWIHGLPRVGLAPSEPGNYRIRKEPRPECLSTIESIVLALRSLEPETVGLEGLIDAFTAMVDQQLDYAKRGEGSPRRRERRRVALAAIPAALRELSERLILVYTESTQQSEDGRSPERRLVYCAAQRVVDGRCFEAYLRPATELSPKLLGFMGLDADRIGAGEDLASFVRRWRSFAGTDPVLVAWNKTNLDLVESSVGARYESIVLKGVYGNLSAARQGSVESTLERQGLVAEPERFPGRPGRRMAAALSLLRACSESTLGSA